MHMYMTSRYYQTPHMEREKMPMQAYKWQQDKSAHNFATYGES